MVPREVTSSSRGTWRAFIGFTRLAGGGKTFGPCDYCEPTSTGEDAVTLRLRSLRDEVNECGEVREKERASRPAARVNETRFGEERREEKRQRRRK